MNGEMKIWDKHYRHLRTVKRHRGSVSTIRYSPCGTAVASAGDDGRVYVLDAESDTLLHSVKHNSDVTNVEWTGEYLLSADLDGMLVVSRRSDWSEARRITVFLGPITGLCGSSDGRWVCVYSEGILVLYRELIEVRRIVVEKGVIMESLNSRLSFAPNNRFFSVGLQFNQKTPTVDIFGTELERLFSLIGHAAPCEITSFCPQVFRGDGPDGWKGKYCVLAVASQDLSISFWCTANAVPFLLIKNFTEAPVLDMCWDGNILYTSSYDGTVKKIEFSAGELGEPTADNGEYEEISLPASRKSIELADTLSTRQERLDLAEKIEPVKLAELSVPDSQQQTVRDTTDELPNRIDVTKIETEQPKRITPVVLTGRSSAAPVTFKSAIRGVVLFDTKIPDKLRMAPSEPFKHRIGDFLIEVSADSSRLVVSRYDLPFFTISGNIAKVCFNETYLAVYTEHLQIYYIETGCLVLPFISTRISFLDLLGRRLLLVDTYGGFSLLDLKSKRGLSGHLYKTKGLCRVELHGKYCILAEYSDEIVFYDRRLGQWIQLNPKFDSILTTALNPSAGGQDETLEQLECRFRAFVLVSDRYNIVVVAKRLIGLIKRIGSLDQKTEYLIENILGEIKEKDIQRKLVEEMNTEGFLQQTVDRVCDKYNI